MKSRDINGKAPNRTDKGLQKVLKPKATAFTFSTHSARCIVAALFAVSVFVFYTFLYKGHLHYQEEMQLFLYTGEYAAEVIWVPGGLADYIARFLTQFFCFPAAGGLIMALLLLGLQRVAWNLCPRRETSVVYALSFVPAVLMWMLMCDANAMLSMPVALLITAGEARKVMRVRPNAARFICMVVSVPLMYMFCGPVGLAFAVYAAVQCLSDSGTRLWLKVLMVVVPAAEALLCPILAQGFFPYPSASMWEGIHYHRYVGEAVTAGWIAVWSIALLQILSLCVRNRKMLTKITWTEMLAYAAVCVLVVFGVFAGRADYVKESVYEFDRLADRGDWQGIIEKASSGPVSSQMQAIYLNLALQKQGRLEHDLFKYVQHGEQGLYEPFGDNYFTPLATAEMYYNIGALKAAQSYTFDILQSVPDFQQSRRCMMRLAEIYLIDGKYELAEKYLRTLSKSLLYDTWAEERLALCHNDSAVEAHPVYGPMRGMRTSSRDFVNYRDLAENLVFLLQDNPGNSAAYSYLVARCLLAKDLAMLAQITPPNVSLPMPVQEALVHYWAIDHTDWTGLPWNIGDDVKKRYVHTLTALRRNPSPDETKRICAGTYWEYFFTE